MTPAEPSYTARDEGAPRPPKRVALAACLAEAHANPYLGDDAPLDWMAEIEAAVGADD